MMRTKLITLAGLCIQVLISLKVHVLADPYLDPVTRTNVNKVDPLFRKSVSDYAGYEKSIDNMANASIENTKNQQAYKELAGGKDADGKASELSNISAQNLQDKGQEEFAKDPTMNDIFVNYSKPGMIEHREDAKRIADATAALSNSLLSELKKLGVNCKTVKGNKIINPEYFIEIVKVTDRDKGNTVYDKYMCEHLRNTYSCSDTLTMKCNSEGMQWGEWQDKKIIVPGDELVDYKNDLLEGDYVAKETFEYKLFIGGRKGSTPFQKLPPNPALVDRARVYLATKHENATKDNIDTTMRAEWGGGIHSISGRQYGGRTLGSKDYVHLSYHIYYRYRDGKLACLAWSENVSEQCILK